MLYKLIYYSISKFSDKVINLYDKKEYDFNATFNMINNYIVESKENIKRFCDYSTLGNYFTISIKLKRK